MAPCEFAELERTEREANKPRHREAEMVEHVAYLAVFAFPDGERKPNIRPWTRSSTASIGP